MAKHKILHYKDDCISCGACAAIYPEFWEMDDEGLAHLKESRKLKIIGKELLLLKKLEQETKKQLKRVLLT